MSSGLAAKRLAPRSGAGELRSSEPDLPVNDLARYKGRRSLPLRPRVVYLIGVVVYP